MTMQPTSPILALHGISYRYPDGSLGLDNCTLSIGRGSRTAILGVNGAGKTTMFHHLNGILRPDSGHVLYDGVPLDYSRRGLHTLRSRIGLVFQNPDSQLFSASVQEDISFGPMNLGLETAVVRSRVAEALQAVGLSGIADKPVHNLSFGQKKRTCIAGVLAMQPEVIVLDEPMAGLDPRMQTELNKILDGLHRAGMTIVIATHDIDFAYHWADTISILADGRCDASWDVSQIPEHLDQFAAYGLGVPRVAELHNSLVQRGVLESGKHCPRSQHELLELLSGIATGTRVS